MSTSTSASASKAGRIDRILAAVHLGKKNKASAGADGGTQTAETLTFKTDDLVPKLNAHAQTIKLTGSLYLELRVELTGEFATANSTNDLFATDAKKIANGWFGKDIDELVSSMERVIENVDKSGSAKERAVFQQAFEAACKVESDRLSINFERKMQQYIDSNKAIKAAYKTYKIKSVISIAQNIGIVITSIVVTGVTWGATGPVAVVAIVRSCAGIGVQIYELAIGTERVIHDIESTLNVLGKIIVQIDKNTENPKLAIALNSTFEAAVGAAAGILNVPLPSVETLGHQIELLGTNLQRMHIERQGLGKEMSGLSKEIASYEGKIAENLKAKVLDANMLRTHQGYVKEFRENHKLIADQAENAFGNIKNVIARHQEFAEQLKLYKASQIKWSRKTKLVFGFATSVGLSVGSADSGLEKGLAALNECLAKAQEKVFEYV